MIMLLLEISFHGPSYVKLAAYFISSLLAFALVDNLARGLSRVFFLFGLSSLQLLLFVLSLGCAMFSNLCSHWMRSKMRSLQQHNRHAIIRSGWGELFVYKKTYKNNFRIVFFAVSFCFFSLPLLLHPICSVDISLVSISHPRTIDSIFCYGNGWTSNENNNGCVKQTNYNFHSTHYLKSSASTSSIQVALLVC